MLPYNSIQQITFHQHVTIFVATHSLRVVGVYSSYKATTKGFGTRASKESKR